MARELPNVAARVGHTAVESSPALPTFLPRTGTPIRSPPLNMENPADAGFSILRGHHAPEGSVLLSEEEEGSFFLLRRCLFQNIDSLHIMIL